MHFEALGISVLLFLNLLAVAMNISVSSTSKTCVFHKDLLKQYEEMKTQLGNLSTALSALNITISYMRGRGELDEHE